MSDSLPVFDISATTMGHSCEVKVINITGELAVDLLLYG